MRNAQAVKNLLRLLKADTSGKKVIIISAMGKTTNALETVVRKWHNNVFPQMEIDAVFNYHKTIIHELFNENSLGEVLEEIKSYQENLLSICSKAISNNYAEDYDRVVSYGEILSTRIIYHYLKKNKLKIAWADARKLIKTNDLFREALVDWPLSCRLINTLSQEVFIENDYMLSQGFIGSDQHDRTTTLGREGSDFSGAIFAHCLDAESLTIWKDVPGLLNADPKIFEKTIKLNQISYGETVELAYYGASIIHPKTVKPLQNKQIPLYVRSFVDHQENGSIIHEENQHDRQVPSFIVKQNQVLMSISPRDYSFMNEDHLAKIFTLFAQLHIKVNVMQNSAISFSACVDDIPEKMEAFINEMKREYKIRYNRGLRLMTIRHYTAEAIQRITNGSNILLEQRSRSTLQLVMEHKEESLWIK